MVFPKRSKTQASLPLQAIVQMNPTKASGELLTPAESGDLAERLITRVAGQVGRGATRVNVLRNLATMVVEADQEFLDSLAQQPEVKSSQPATSSESVMIKPIRKRKA